MDLRSPRFWAIVAIAVLAVAGGIYFLASGDAASARQAVDDTAREVTGARAVQQGEEVKAQLKGIPGLRRAPLESGGEK